jgi:DNA-binding MarR family transcriptional regulator
MEELLLFEGALYELAKLYQFRGLEDPAYRSLTVSQWWCLRNLALATSPRTMSQLAEDLDLKRSPQEVSSVIRRTTP